MINKYFKMFDDGFQFLWWIVKFNSSIGVRMCIGIEHVVGPWNEDKLTNSSLNVYLGPVKITFEHCGTTIRL